MSRKKIIRVATVPTSFLVLLNGQLKMLAEKYEVIAVSSPGKEMKQIEDREGVHTVAIPMERRISLYKDILSLIRLVRFFRQEKPDMVHSITPKAGLLAMVAAWLARVPVRIHTFTGLIFPTTSGNLKRLLIATDRLTCFCATHINPEGEGVKRNLNEYKITNKPLNVIANGNVNGIDLHYYDRTAEVETKAAGIRKPGCFTFCFVGRIVRDKGINELLRAFVRLHASRCNTRLLLAGSFEEALDPIDPEVKQMIFNHPAVRFLGWQDDVRPILAAADALVFPSYREGFPNVVIQAGAMGLPAIVTDINGCNEIIQPGKNGIIIPPRDEQSLYDGMSWFLLHPNKIKEMAAQARRSVASRYDRRFVWEALSEEYRSLLKDS